LEQTINGFSKTLLDELLVQEVGLGVLFVLAFANGANDVGKSVAPLVDDPKSLKSRSARRALLWGGILSGLGSLSAILLSGRLFQIFTQRMVETTPTPPFALAALAGATVWILIATLVKLPVSTTHAIIGAIVIQAVYLYGLGDIQWDTLGLRVLLPLAAGPVIALLTTSVLGRISSRLRTQKVAENRTSITEWGSSGATSYARGINDAPKIAALGSFLLFGSLTTVNWFPYAIVSVAVVLGALVLGHKVTETVLAEAPIDQEKRLRAGFTTAALVSAGAILGTPLSTTHMHRGAIEGARHGLGGIVRTILKESLLPWCVTFPVAGILAIAVSFLAGRI
jgi:inorganic phosphate transporter, PiT family